METINANTWRAAGFTDDVTECGICGKAELKGTVRMVTEDGDEVYAGVICAARATGRRTTQIRDEANRADAVFKATWQAWGNAHQSAKIALRDEALVAAGHDPRNARFEACSTALDSAHVRDGMAAWKDANPEPPRPSLTRRR